MAFTGGKGLKGQLFKVFDLLKELPGTDIKEVYADAEVSE